MLKPRIGLLLGDPAGIGPEIIAKLLAIPDTAELADVWLIGDPRVYRSGVEIAGVSDQGPAYLECSIDAHDVPRAQPSAAAGAYVLASLRRAIQAIGEGAIDGIVYAPLNKQAMKLAGLTQSDELHYLAELLNYAGDVSELNVCDELWTSRVTSHVPFRDIAGLLTIEKIAASARLLHRSLLTAGIRAPRMAIAALNPHAGEGGIYGTEEITTIGPSVDMLRREGILATGPLPADTIFVAATKGTYNGVVTMYHDQGQIALKLLGFERGVTVSGGLPVVVTTPAHGTAFDIAGQGIANVRPMQEAFALACRMARYQIVLR